MKRGPHLPGKEDVVHVALAQPRLVGGEGLRALREGRAELDLLHAGHRVEHARLHTSK